MRARLIITLALCWCFGAERARADDFDDDFGSLPPERERALLAPQVAPSPPSELAQPAAPTQPPSPTLPEPADAALAPEANARYLPLDAEPELAPAPAADPRRKRRSFVHSTVEGLIGGVHLVDGSSALPGTFRVGLNGGFFRKNGFTAHDDRERALSSALTLNVTPIEHLELAAALDTQSTRNRTMDPEVVQVVGDMHFFAKTFWTVLPWLNVAGDAELALLNGIGSLGVHGGATSVGLRGSATADLRALEHNPLPIIVRSNLRYLFDNSGRLASAIESDRLKSLNSPAATGDEYRQLLNPAERQALGVNRVDRIGMGVGVEVPLTPHARVPVSPLLEWAFALPVNRQSFNCLETSIAGQRDRCLANTGFGARPSTLTMGVRVQPWLEGLSALLAIDVATSGSRTFVRELAPQERYVIRLGVQYAYDARGVPAARPRIQRIEIPVASRHVVGEVVDAQTNAPIAGAVVHFDATTLSDLLSDEQGAFRSAELAPGAQSLRVRADGYAEALCAVSIGPARVDVSVRCPLERNAYYGSLEGRVSDTAGKPIAAAYLSLGGAGELTLSSKKDGSFHEPKLLEGNYELIANAPGYFERKLAFTVTRSAAATPSVVMLARPARSLVRLTMQRIVTSKPVLFHDNTAIVADESQSLLGEVAELLQTHPQLAHVDIEGHMDDSLGQAAALALSEERAQAVRAWLVAAGVDPARLTAKGLGATRPVAPNITRLNRARNRRIDFVLR